MWEQDRQGQGRDHRKEKKDWCLVAEVSELICPVMEGRDQNDSFKEFFRSLFSPAVKFRRDLVALAPEATRLQGLKSLCENSCLALAKLDPRFRGGDSAGFRGCIPTCHSRESGNPRVFTQTLEPRRAPRIKRRT
jgi:hypothetical protein